MRAGDSDEGTLAQRIIALAGLLALLMGIVVAMSMCGCGASGLTTQSRGAQVVAIATGTAGGIVDAARDHALDEVEAAHPEHGEARSAALDAEAARWRPAGQALDAIRELLITWTAAIESARALGEQGATAIWPRILSLAAQAVATYARIADLARGLGADVPVLDLGGLSIGGAQ